MPRMFHPDEYPEDDEYEDDLQWDEEYAEFDEYADDHEDGYMLVYDEY